MTATATLRHKPTGAWPFAGRDQEGPVPSFAKLTAMDDDHFYRHDRGTNYASRATCAITSREGSGREVLQQFRGTPGRPRHKTLMAVWGEADMDAFKKRWEMSRVGAAVP